MKKYIIRAIFHLVALGVALACLWYIYLYWTGAFLPQTSIAFISTNSETTLIDTADFSNSFSQSEYIFLEANCDNSQLRSKTTEMIEQGAKVLVFDLSEAPNADFETFLTEQNLPVIFTSALPSVGFFINSDKAWYFDYTPAYAGELLGKELANGFKNGEILDFDQDIILDYYSQNMEQSFTPIALTSTLTASEQYGVYVNNTAIIIPSTPQTDEETQADETIEDTQNTEDAEEDIEESTENSETSDDETALETELLPKPEVVISVGLEQANANLAIATANGWLEGETPTMLTAIVDSLDDAISLAEEHTYYSFVYLDVKYATKNLSQMVFNLLENKHITNETELTLSEDGGFTVPYITYP